MKIRDIGKSTAKASPHVPTKTYSEVTGKTTSPRILLTSVFGPYAQDDEFGSRLINPMELYQNQVTRGQGPFSIRRFHNSWGLLMIQENISAPCTVLDFPTLEAFKKELTSHHYDIVGITSIIVNVGKVKEMCSIVRKYSPHSKILVGGHVAAIPGLDKIIDADHIVRGDGVSWMRRYLSEDHQAPINHPLVNSGFDLRLMGFPIPEIFLQPSAVIIPSVGCPMGCNFCTTSAFFGGKGRSVIFYKTGRELFRVMCEAESSMKSQTFFVMDENFLLNKQRAMELLELMKAENKSWSFIVFSSANALRQYTMEELVELGVSIVWIGLESPNSTYVKLKDSDTRKLVRDLQANGISVLGSTIIGLEHHTPENIIEDIEYAASHETDLHQFMLYTPMPGTPLYAETEKRGLLLKDTDIADIHGQYKFNFKHPNISRDDSKRLLDWAFKREFELNGPSLYRMARTLLKGWKRHKGHSDLRVRERFRRETGKMVFFNSALWAMEQMYKDKDKKMGEQICKVRLEVEEEFGLRYHIARCLLGPVLLWTGLREEERLANGFTYEPRMFIDRKNWVPERQS